MYKQYLGDGVYIDFENDMLKLTTENGLEVTNTIFLEEAVFGALVEYVNNRIVRNGMPESNDSTVADLSAPRFSAEWMKAWVAENNYTRWALRECSICNALIYYLFQNDGVYFDSSCGCSSSPLEPRTWQDIASTLEMQKDDSIRDHMLERFS